MITRTLITLAVGCGSSSSMLSDPLKVCGSKVSGDRAGDGARLVGVGRFNVAYRLGWKILLMLTRTPSMVQSDGFTLNVSVIVNSSKRKQRGNDEKIIFNNCTKVDVVFFFFF